MQRLKAATALVAGVTLMTGMPGVAPLAITAAHASTKVVCSSVDFDYSYCRTDRRGNVRLVQQLSRAPCIEGRSWGTDRRGIWVDRGCSAKFAISGSGGDAGAIVGAVVIGGVVGALLGSSGKSDRDRDRREPRRYKHDYRDQDNSPAYDRYGNANYDRKGLYQGCHGLGCAVDNPDKPDPSQQIDPRPQFDKDGNPNFDTHGNYIGCHGVGCGVDNPDAN